MGTPEEGPDFPEPPPHQRRHGRWARGFSFGPPPGPGFGPGFGPPGFGPGGPGGPPPWSAWEARAPRARRGDVRAAALVLLAERPMNGYQIIQEIKSRSGGLWTPSSGSVYPALQQLEDEGLIRAGEHDGRRAFFITDAGRAYVEQNADEMAAPWANVAECVAEDAIELRERFGRTFGAFMQVWHAGTEQQREQAARVLDDARRALYRILAEDDR